jgi:hypothetical protein
MYRKINEYLDANIMFTTIGKHNRSNEHFFENVNIKARYPQSTGPFRCLQILNLRLYPF